MSRIPLTVQQHRLLLHHQLYPRDASFNISYAFRIGGPVDLPGMRVALERLLTASAAMNVTFGDGYALRQPREATVPVLAAPPAVDADAEARAVAERVAAFAERPFPLDEWPLYRFELLRGRYASYLTFAVSHLVSDATGLANLLRMLSALLLDDGAWPAMLPQLQDDPGSLVGAAPAVASPNALEAYRGLLLGVSRVTHQHLDVPRRDGAGLLGQHVHRLLPPDLAGPVREGELVKRYGTFPVVVAAYAIVLGALTGERETVVGIPVANRRGRRQRATIGYFVNILPLPLDLDQCQSFGELCQTVAARLPTLLRYQDFDLTAYAAEVFDGRTVTPLALDNAVTLYPAGYTLEVPGCAVEKLGVDRRGIRNPLAMNVDATADNLIVGMEYLDRLAPAEPLDCFEEVLRRALAQPEIPPRRLTVLDGRREARIQAIGGARRRLATPSTVDGWCAGVARRHADRVAVSDEHGSWTYAELDDAVERVAAGLAASSAGPYVAVAMRRRRELVAVLLGILRAGRAYVPLDPHAPAERVRHIAGQFDHLVLVGDPGLLPDAPVASRLDAAVLLATAPAPAPAATHGGDGTAYVIFTSGSTGVPKGVAVTHANVMRLFAATAEHYDFGPDDVWCLFHSYAFDFAVWEMFGALLYGGRLVVVPDQLIRSPAEFTDLLVREQVTVLNQTPSAFRRLTGVLTPQRAARLAVRWVVFGGEALHFDILQPWLDLAGRRARLVNMYGITETTVHTTFYEVDPESVGVEGESVIGRPLADLSTVVVDHNFHRCPLGVPGELLILGDGVAQGYLGRPDLTAERFLSGTRYGPVAYRSGDRCYLRADGNLVYLGRIDRQVQLRGHRIEPGEVEAALRAVPSIGDAYVGVHAPAGTEPHLVAWVVGGHGLDDGAIRTALEARLPRYLVPTRFVRVEALPLNVNGKIDGAALPVPAAPVSASARADGLVAQLARIWTETIRCTAVGPDDNFFDVGGTSMHITEIHRRLVTELGAADLAMIELFEFPTPRRLADRIGSGTAPLTADTPIGRRHRRVGTGRREGR